MFKNLTNFSYQRNVKEAIGFYLAYFLLITIAGGLLGAILGIVVSNSSYNLGMRTGTVVAIIACPGLSFLVLRDKKLIDNFKFILLALLSGVLAIFIGALGGLIPIAYLTTRSVDTQ